MASHDLIDSQFDRAVQIVQSLPKTGPIQTDYEEKLQMYSLYKQATVGNVQPPRPGIFDMLGRAKWDAWEKHKDLDPYEAKWLYVEALMKVLRKYSDKTIARDLVQELESFGGDPSNIVMSRTFTKSTESDTTDSTSSDDGRELPYPQSTAPQYGTQPPAEEETGSGSEEDGSDEDEAGELPPSRTVVQYDNRPQSSISSRRYRTPTAGSLLLSPPPDQRVPQSQPHPAFETPSAFAAVATPPLYPQYARSHSETIRGEQTSPQNFYPSPLSYRGGQYGPARPASRPTLEHAIENAQAHLAALTERIESLETRMISRSHSSLSPKGGSSPPWFGGRGSPHDGSDGPRWDIEDLGLWSVVLRPLSRGADHLRDWATFLASDENRSPAKMIVRRLVLDVSFLVFVVAVIGAVWRRSGGRRREVRSALGILWRALIGSKPRRAVADKGV